MAKGCRFKLGSWRLGACLCVTVGKSAHRTAGTSDCVRPRPKYRAASAAATQGGSFPDHLEVLLPVVCVGGGGGVM